MTVRQPGTSSFARASQVALYPGVGFFGGRSCNALAVFQLPRDYPPRLPRVQPVRSGLHAVFADDHRHREASTSPAATGEAFSLADERGSTPTKKGHLGCWRGRPPRSEPCHREGEPPGAAPGAEVKGAADAAPGASKGQEPPSLPPARGPHNGGYVTSPLPDRGCGLVGLSPLGGAGQRAADAGASPAPGR